MERQAFFFEAFPSSVTIKRWDAKLEDFAPGHGLVDDKERDRYIEGVRRFDFDANLGAYNFDDMPRWKQLSSFVTVDVLSNLGIALGAILAGGDASRVDELESLPYRKRQAEMQQAGSSSNVVPFHEHLPRVAQFAVLPQVYTGTDPALRTRWHMDGTYKLGEMLHRSSTVCDGRFKGASFALLNPQSL